MRSFDRHPSALRPLEFTPHFTAHPEGSCLVKMGQTWVLATASIEEKVPPFLEGQGSGWITAEYSMLPRSTHTRSRREASTGKLSGRTQEIQRLIGRSLRACLDLRQLGERTITIDCDVLQADGGTRTASINGGFVAMVLAVKKLQREKKLTLSPVRHGLAAVSLGMRKGEILVDLDYKEDSSCDVDMNFVMLENGQIVEMQGSAEKNTFSMDEAQAMMKQAASACAGIFERQRAVLAE